MATRTCKRCGFPADEEWYFQYGPKGVYHGKHRSVCPGCMQEEKDRCKHLDRADAKARKVLYNHADKYEIEPMEFARKFGWNIKQIAHDINYNFKNSCPYCNQPYEDMGHGLGDLTLDIINPTEPPYYATNVKFCCSTCNSIKGQQGVEAFGRHLAQMAERKEWLAIQLLTQDGTLLKPQYRMHLDGNN